MVCGMSVAAFIIGVVWPIVALIGSFVISVTSAYEGKKAEVIDDPRFQDWYNTL